MTVHTLPLPRHSKRRTPAQVCQYTGASGAAEGPLEPCLIAALIRVRSEFLETARTEGFTREQAIADLEYELLDIAALNDNAVSTEALEQCIALLAEHAPHAERPQ